MSTKQTVAIIGASGKMGSAIAESLAAGNYRVLLFSRNKEKGSALAEKLRQVNKDADVDYYQCQHEACWEADIIIPAVPYAHQLQASEIFRDVATQKIVISIVNPFNSQRNGLLTKEGESAAFELQESMPHAYVVKAFNTNPADTFGKTENGVPFDSFIAGDDAEAVKIVTELVQQAGFHPVIAGGLEKAAMLEQMALMLHGLKQTNPEDKIGFKILHQ